MAMTRPLAQGHEVVAGKPAVIRPAADNAASWPAGSMFSNVQDLARFVLAFLDGGKLDGKQVLPAELVATLSTRRTDIPGSAGGYGYGLNVSRERGVSWVQHGGSRAGYGSSIVMVPDQNFGVIIVANRTGSSMPKTSAAIVEMFLDLEAKKKDGSEMRPLTASDLARYAGTYANGAQRISLVSEGGVLVRGATRFTKAGKDFLSVDASGEGPAPRLVGVSGPSGKIEYLHSGGRSYRRVN
jgi:CubicO group peptidase (beta-lactamase class C family)